MENQNHDASSGTQNQSLPSGSQTRVGQGDGDSSGSGKRRVKKEREPFISPSVSEQVLKDDPELDALLDAAMLDFGKPVPRLDPALKLKQKQESAEPEGDVDQIWSEEFIQEATAQFEKKMREYASQAKAKAKSGKSTKSGGPSTSATTSKVIEETRKALEIDTRIHGFEASWNEAMKTLTANTKYAGKTEWDDRELDKLMGSLGMEDDGEVDKILPFMNTMMQKLLSKDILQPVLVDMVQRYPEWLRQNKSKISQSQYDKYVNQYENMKQICDEYSKEKDTDSEQVKSQRFDKISEYMLKVQSSGPPPKDLVDEDTNNGAGAAGFGFPALDPDLNSQCCIM